ncbi:hypothetical protein [Mesorhizobium sp. LjNodule214]|uniref:hypothetical protein n=1 Tax=Mesorhizobium sp. LjNodule214 TaxID=3342252 RepID=UPI003ECD5EDA
MKEEIRRAVAYAAAARALKKATSSIYSYEKARHSHMSSNYDYDSGSHLSGVNSGNMYHYGLGAHVSLRVTGANFSGYDYESGGHFSGRILGRSVQLYDYGEGRHFNYSV